MSDELIHQIDISPAFKNNIIVKTLFLKDSFLNQEPKRLSSFFEDWHKPRLWLAVNVGARRGLQSALIGPCGRILTEVCL
jgi:hypothetical protein